MFEDFDERKLHHAFLEPALHERGVAPQDAKGAGIPQARHADMDPTLAAVALCLGTARSRSGSAPLAEPLAAVDAMRRRQPIAEITRELVEALTALSIYLDTGAHLFSEGEDRQPARLGSVIRKARARAEHATGIVHQLRHFLKITDDLGGEAVEDATTT